MNIFFDVSKSRQLYSIWLNKLLTNENIPLMTGMDCGLSLDFVSADFKQHFFKSNLPVTKTYTLFKASHYAGVKASGARIPRRMGPLTMG